MTFEETAPRRPVSVHAMTLGLDDGQEPSEWFAACPACNWYGAERPSLRGAQADAGRHRRSHGTTPEGQP